MGSRAEVQQHPAPGVCVCVWGGSGKGQAADLLRSQGGDLVQPESFVVKSAARFVLQVAEREARAWRGSGLLQRRPGPARRVNMSTCQHP